MPMAADPAEFWHFLNERPRSITTPEGRPEGGLLRIAVRGRRYGIDWQRTNYVHAPLIDMPKRSV
jgi:hypothetical protein